MTFDELVERVTPPKPAGENRWLLEEYKGSEKDRADAIFSTCYWHLREKAERQYAKAREEDKTLPPIRWDRPTTEKEILADNKQSKAARDKLFTDALNQAAIVSNLNKEGFERAFLILSGRVKRTGSFRFAEANTFEEWVVENIFDLPKGSPKLSYFLYYQNELIPMIEELGNGFTEEDLTAFKEYKAKAFGAVPVLRQLTDQARETRTFFEEEIQKKKARISKLEIRLESLNPQTKEAKEVQEKLEEVEREKEKLETEAPQAIAFTYKKVKDAVEKTIELLKNPSVPAWDPVNGIQAQLKRNGNAPTIFKGSKMYTTDPEQGDMTVIFLATLPKKYEQAFESLVRHLVDFSPSDGEIFIELAEMITKGKDKLKGRRK